MTYDKTNAELFWSSESLYFDEGGGRGLSKEKFLSFIQSMVESKDLSKVWVEVPITGENLSLKDDVYGVISKGYSCPVERRYVADKNRWAYPYEKDVDILYDDGVLYYLELRSLPTQAEGAIGEGYVQRLKDRMLDTDKMSDNYIKHKAEGFNNGLMEAIILINS